MSRGLLNKNLLRTYNVQALIDTGAVRTVLPLNIVQQLGLRIRVHCKNQRLIPNPDHPDYPVLRV